MNRRIITIMICMGLVALGTTSVMAKTTNLNMNIAQSLVKLKMLTYEEENIGVTTGGLLYEDSYEIEILDGSYFQIKKIERVMKNINAGLIRMVHVRDVDLKITYNKLIADEENVTELFATCLYEKNSFDVINGSEIINKPHTIIIEGFTGWFFTMGIGAWNLEENGPGDFWFAGSCENIQIIEGF